MDLPSIHHEHSLRLDPWNAHGAGRQGLGAVEVDVEEFRGMMVIIGSLTNFTAHLDHVSDFNTTSSMFWSNRWTYRACVINSCRN